MKGILRVDYEEELNEEQKKVVFAGEGPVLVIAGAGSGKTRTVTYRVARLIEKGVDPSSILLATFTNKAAREMLHRVECLLGISLEDMWGGTFHHIGNLILRREAKKIGYDNNYTIMDREDQKDLLETTIEEMGIDRRSRRFPKGDVVANIISLSRNTFISVEDILQKFYPQFFDWIGQLSALFALYQEKKRQLSLMDYDDLLYYTWLLLRENENTRRKYGNAFHHILVDEYQDTNLLQAEMIDLLAQEYHNILAVGDDAQSIYSFRGANFANIMRFPERYPDCQVFKLETNYRSTAPILDLANQVISFNRRQFPKVLHPVKRGGEKPVVVPLRDVMEQAEFVASQILELHNEGYDLREIAVLYRAHYHSMEIQMELTRRGIPFEIRSGLRFFEQAHIKDVVAYLKVVANPRDEMAWKRVLKLYPGIGKASAEKVWGVIASSPDPLTTLEREEIISLLPVNARVSLASLKDLLFRLEDLDSSPSTLIREVLEGGYRDYLVTHYPNYQEREEDLEELANFSLRYQSLDTFLSELALLGEMEGENVVRGGIEDDKIVLSTIHQAKGLEWDCVFMVWLCEGGFPSPRSLGKEEDIEEERRLFYVACTRAREHLFLCYPILGERNHAHSMVRKPSRFLQELDPRSYTKWRGGMKK
ncbi:MAG: ATP-dependent helicase UvrD/PcrA [Candidatus Atribacteria bacterium]|nr:ATP-dependent helicase UvrD/PcrA [Candidatus Atribacteria bacterium]